MKNIILTLFCVSMIGCASSKENQKLKDRIQLLDLKVWQQLKHNEKLQEENYGYKKLIKNAIQESYEKHLKEKEK